MWRKLNPAKAFCFYFASCDGSFVQIFFVLPFLVHSCAQLVEHEHVIDLPRCSGILCWQRAGRELKRKNRMKEIRIYIILNSANIELMSGTYDSVHRWNCHIRHENYYIYSTIKIHDGWVLPGCNECDIWLQNAIAANWVKRKRRKCVIAVVLVIVMMFKSCILCDQK